MTSIWALIGANSAVALTHISHTVSLFLPPAFYLPLYVAQFACKSSKRNTTKLLSSSIYYSSLYNKTVITSSIPSKTFYSRSPSCKYYTSEQNFYPKAQLLNKTRVNFQAKYHTPIHISPIHSLLLPIHIYINLQCANANALHQRKTMTLPLPNVRTYYLSVR